MKTPHKLPRLIGLALLGCSLVLLPSCASKCCTNNYQVEGAEEFVLDSYQIRQGKLSILALAGESLPPLPCEYLNEYQDQVDNDDVLTIALFHPTRPDLTTAISNIGGSVGYRVMDGYIHVPNLEPVYVLGLTLEQTRVKLQKLYDDVIADTEVFVEYGERQHSKVLLTGAVKVPEVPVNGRIRLYEVISLAGVPGSANLYKSYVEREGSILPVDLFALMHLGDMSQNIVMRPRDKIFIADPAEANIMVMGEVGIPMVIPVPRGSISLREALAAAGGIPFTGDKRFIQVIRGSILCPKIYMLSWNHITYLPNESLLLMPGDTVYITEKPITKWNRFIEQLLPSSLLIDLGVRASGAFRG